MVEITGVFGFLIRYKSATHPLRRYTPAKGVQDMVDVLPEGTILINPRRPAETAAKFLY